MLKSVLISAFVILIPISSFARPGVSIDSVTTEGKGCPAGSAVVSLSADATLFTVIFSSFSVEIGPGVAKRFAQRRCKVHVKLTVPKGWAYALESVDFRGYANLDAGVAAIRRAKYHISGETPEKVVSADLVGDRDDDYFVRDLGDDEGYWSNCGKGKNLKIVTELDLTSTNPAGRGLFTVDSVDGETYHLAWKRCP